MLSNHHYAIRLPKSIRHKVFRQRRYDPLIVINQVHERVFSGLEWGFGDP